MRYGEGEPGFNPAEFKVPDELEPQEEIGTETGLARAQVAERSMFERLRGRARDVAKLLLVSTALSVGGLAAETRSAFAAEPTKAGDSAVPGGKAKAEQARTPEQEQQRKKELTMSLLSELEGIKNSMDEEGDAMLARDLIFMYTLELNGKSEGKVAPKDVYRALKFATGQTGDYFDQQHGDKDGEVDVDEMNGFNGLLKGSIGLRQFMEMSVQYSQMYAAEEAPPPSTKI
jgi:hypothetical protein